MSPQPFNKDFARHFRNESELYTLKEEFPFGNLLIRQYASDNGEMSVTGEKLIDQFFNTRLLHKILHTLKNDNLPFTRKLFNKIITFKNECETYQQQEPYTALFFKDHIAMFISFSRLMNAFKNDFQNKVYAPLDQYYTCLVESVNIPAADSSSLVQIIELTEFYLKNISNYYNYFITTWQFEVNNSRSRKGIQLTSYMANQLQALISYTEDLMDCTENIRSLLLTWETQMEIKEQQELYN